MQVVVLLFLIVLLFISLACYKSITCPLVFINLLFALIFLGITIKPFEIKTDSTLAYFLVLIGMVMINIGYHIFSLGDNQPVINRASFVSYESNKVVLYLLIAVLIVFSAYYVVEALILFKRGYSLNMVRLFFFGDSELIETATGVKRNLLIDYGTAYLYQPCQYLCIGISSVAAFNKNYLSDSKKTKIAMIIITIINVIVSMLTNGGRVILFFLILCFALSFLFYRKKTGKNNNKRLKKTRRYLFLSLIVLICVAVFVTFSRSADSSILQSVFYYFCGSIPNMEMNLANVDTSNYTYGLAFFSGLVRPLFTAVKFAFGLPLPEVFTRADSFLFDASATYYIADGVEYNAFVTIFYFFYRDSGYIGIVFESFVFGLILSIVYQKAKKNVSNPKYIILYLILMIGVSTSFIRWQLLSVSYAMTFYYWFFAFRCPKARIECSRKVFC